MFYLTMHSTHFIQLYGVAHMVKDHSDSERGNTLLAHRLLLQISRQGLFYMHHPTDRIIHGLCYTSRGALAGTRSIYASESAPPVQMG